jgi:hypothetical protein
MAASLPKCCVKKDGGVPFPSVVNLYDFFAPRTKDITAWSFGFRNGEFECDIAESTGAKLQIFDAREGHSQRYEIYNRIMNTHETDAADPEWAKDLTEYWILPDSTSFSSTLPGLYSGSLSLSGTLTQFSVFAAERVDLVKVDYGEHTGFLVSSLLQNGYRPGLLWVHWDKHPDESNITMAIAGNIQTLGYRLLKAEGNYFVYMFVDDCMYEICSWARTDCANPMFLEFKDQLFSGLLVGSASATAPTENPKKE